MMESKAYNNFRGHAVCITGPFQSHMKAMLKFAKLLHHKGFYITFVTTEFIHKRLLKSMGHDSLDGLPNFRFETIPDGLPLPSSSSDDGEKNPRQDPIAVCENITNDVMLQPFLDLLAKLNHSPNLDPVSCIVSDAFMPFTVTAAQEVGLPILLFFPLAASSVMGSQRLYTLKLKGLIQHFKDENCLTEEDLDTAVEGIPGMKDVCMRDLLTYIRSNSGPESPFFDFSMKSAEEASKASAVVIHTFDALEQQALDVLSSVFPKLFAIGPLQLFLNQIGGEEDRQLNCIGQSLWKEETGCLKWLDSKQPKSVIYVNFGSGMVITKEQFIELALGLANSDQQFLWIIREDFVIGTGNPTDLLPEEFEVRAKGKGYTGSWCPQEQVLNHPSVGGFLTHCGWGSTIESVSAGVPMICWPFIDEQELNCRCICREWKVGMDIKDKGEAIINRNKVEMFVREMMQGEKGKNLRNNAAEWKRLAEAAAANPDGSSFKNLDKLVSQILTTTHHRN